MVARSAAWKLSVAILGMVLASGCSKQQDARAVAVTPPSATTQAINVATSLNDSELSIVSDPQSTDCVGSSAELVEAVGKAEPGDEVLLCEATFDIAEVQSTPLVVDNGISLVGASHKAVVSHSGVVGNNGKTGSVISLDRADGASLKNFTVAGPVDGDAYAGIWVEDSNSVEIAEMQIRDFRRTGLGYGIVPQTAGGTVKDLHIYNSIFEANRHGVTSATGANIVDMLVEDNAFLNHTDAAIDNHWGAVGTTFRNNTITQGELSSSQGASGIVMQATSGFLIEGNEIDLGSKSQGGHGILIQYIADASPAEITGVVKDNLVTNLGNDSGSSSEVGVYIDADADGVPANLPFDVEIDGLNIIEFHDSGRSLLFQTPDGQDYESSESPLPNSFYKSSE